MAWAKTNWMIVVLVAVAILVLPGLWVFSSMMNAKLRESHQKNVDKAIKPLLQPSVTYSITMPDGRRIEELSVAPTTQTTAWYSKQWQSLKSEMDKVGGAAEAFNKHGHKALVEDLFPKPSPLEDVFKRRRLAELFKQNHAAEGPLLTAINAGGPASTEQLAEMLKDFRKNKEEQFQNERNTQPDPATTQQWQDEALQIRLGQYQLRARQIALYADESSFPALPNIRQEPSLAECWDLQEQYWIHEDILAAIKRANEAGDTGSAESGVSGSVIKRLLSLQAGDVDYDAAQEPAPGAAQPPVPPPMDPGMDGGGGGMPPAGPNFTGNLTGRRGGAEAGNFYDVRKATVRVVADAERLPVFFDALAATNFITVLDVDMTAVDTATDLKGGYYYGTRPVVEATIEVETIWLRSWRVPMMPAGVKNFLHVPEPPPPAPGTEPGMDGQPPANG